MSGPETRLQKRQRMASLPNLDDYCFYDFRLNNGKHWSLLQQFMNKLWMANRALEHGFWLSHEEFLEELTTVVLVITKSEPADIVGYFVRGRESTHDKIEIRYFQVFSHRRGYGSMIISMLLDQYLQIDASCVTCSAQPFWEKKQREHGSERLTFW